MQHGCNSFQEVPESLVDGKEDLTREETREETKERKLKLYEAQVVSVLMYNSNSWAPTKAALNELDVTHRRHLRTILNIKWSRGMIRNVTLYKRCNVVKLSDRVNTIWRILEHVLRSDGNTNLYHLR